MKSYLLPLLLMPFFSCNCKKDRGAVLGNSDQHIIFQPIGAFPTAEIMLLATETEAMFNRSVRINTPLSWPITRPVNADSLLRAFASCRAEHTALVIGLTQSPLSTHENAGSKLFGFSQWPGRAAVVSSAGIVNADHGITAARLKKVTFHEIGHNLGLPHCKDRVCVMSGSNGNIHMLDAMSAAYCSGCQKRAGL